MILRIFWGWVTGTVLNLTVFQVFALANGTPVPSWHSPVALLDYPTGSVRATLGFAFTVYFLALVIICFLPRRRRQ